MHITAISFDGDMTLWDFQKVMRHSLKHTLIALQNEVSTERAQNLTVDKMIEIRNQFAEEVKGQFWKLEELRRVAFERTLKWVDYPNKDFAAHLNQVYLKHRFEDIELYEDVLPTLDILAPHFKLGFLSNGNSYPDRCGLEGRFDFVILSQDVQVEKPNRKIFDITAEKAGCDLKHLLHVGDSLENDVAGAQNAGAKSVWLNRDHQKNNTCINVDFEVTSLLEIPPILEEDLGESPL